jgi:hypothetical protein
MGARRRTLLRRSALGHGRVHVEHWLACFGHELRALNIAGMAAASRMERWFGPIRTTLPYFSCSCCMIRCWCPARDTYDHQIRDVRAKGGPGNLARGWNGEIRYRIVDVTRARMYTAKDGKNERRAPNVRMRGGPRTSVSMLLIESGSWRLTTAWASCRVRQTESRGHGCGSMRTTPASPGATNGCPATPAMSIDGGRQRDTECGRRKPAQTYEQCTVVLRGAV